MIVNKEIVDTKKKRSGEVENVYEFKLNVDFWRGIKEPISVIIDEAHSVINARKSMSRINIILTDWLALIRRVLGSGDAGYGELILVTQLSNRLDVIAREMATQIKYHVCHYRKTCKDCGVSWSENSEMPEPLYCCPSCGSFSLLKHGHQVEVWCFDKMSTYEAWKMFGGNLFYNHYVINDIEEVFPLYNTLQWDNMFSELY